MGRKVIRTSYQDNRKDYYIKTAAQLDEITADVLPPDQGLGLGEDE